MTTFVLIQAGEGMTKNVFVANGSRDELIRIICKAHDRALTEEPESEKPFIEEQRDALISMLKKHQDWTPGRHTLENIEPHWQEWTLIITEDQFGDYW